jgi:hypothetical protein
MPSSWAQNSLLWVSFLKCSFYPPATPYLILPFWVVNCGPCSVFLLSPSIQRLTLGSCPLPAPLEAKKRAHPPTFS